MKYGSLFSGLGGLDLGLDRAGWECRWQIESDEYCRRVLEQNWPHVKRYGDIRTVSAAELEGVDLIAGGFPCQDLSVAGQRKGLVNGDGTATRSGLWFEFARLVSDLRPRFVAAENTPGILAVRGAISRVCGDLARCGYVGCIVPLRASDFGASHLRKRVFIIATLGDTVRGQRQQRGRSESQPLPDADTSLPGSDGGCDAVADASDGQLSFAFWERDGPRPAGAVAELGDAEFAGLEIGDIEREQQLRQVAESLPPGVPTFAPGPEDERWRDILAVRPDLAPALVAPLRRVAHGTPDWLVRAMSNRTVRLSRLGNAVVPQCGEYIGRKLLEFDAQ